jgi:CO dehydrogenase/acetyl-CoA synthase delta subunit
VAYVDPVEKSSGEIREVALGREGSQVLVGGEKAMPFCSFDGALPHRAVIAMEVYDARPEGWAEALETALGDVMGDAVAWAKKCESDFGADMICLQLASTDPNGADTGADEAAALAKSVCDAVSIPVIVYGCMNAEKDGEVLKKVAESCAGSNVVIGPATEDDYKPVAAAAMGYGEINAGNSPIDVNMAKQLNILMTGMGLDASKLIIDPSCGAIGYGLEYAYSVTERLRLAALSQNDKMTQMPILANLGKEVWRTKEARVGEDEEPNWGDPTKRGIIWEAMTAMAVALAGSDILVMRHPDAVALVRTALNGLEV